MVMKHTLKNILKLLYAMDDLATLAAIEAKQAGDMERYKELTARAEDMRTLVYLIKDEAFFDRMVEIVYK